jgi:N-acetylmuramoyl-L-alanine amidase
MDLAGPAKIDKAYVLDATADQPARLIVELSAVDRATFLQNLVVPARPAKAAVEAAVAAAPADARPVVVIDPGHGGIDTGTQTADGESEKTLVLDFALALRERLNKAGKYRVVMTRTDDTFIALGERVRRARAEKAALFISVHADALPKSEGDVQGATVYTLSDRASDAEAERLAESENRADAIAGIDLTEEPSEVADILIDLAQRETRTFSGRFAKLLVGEMKNVAKLHKKPLKSAGFKVLRAPDVPSVLVELGYVSNKENLQDLKSNQWRARAVGSVAQAVDGFFAKKVVERDGVK